MVHHVYSQISCIALRVFQTSKGFWIFLFRQLLSGGGVIMQITMQRACPARPPMTPDSSRIAKEFAWWEEFLSIYLIVRVKHHDYISRQTLNGDERYVLWRSSTRTLFPWTFQMSMKTLPVKAKMANCEKRALPTVGKMVTWSSQLFHFCRKREA